MQCEEDEIVQLNQCLINDLVLYNLKAYKYALYFRHNLMEFVLRYF